MRLRPKNWDSFQHYKDRQPVWIKLHCSLLKNMEFHQLSAPAAKFLVLFWLLASENVDGAVDENLSRLEFRLRFKQTEIRKCIDELIAAEFIERVDAEESTAKTKAELNGFSSRYISDKTKAEVWIRDNGKCRQCGSGENLEYDHVIPVSKGGPAVAGNIQLLCRACNRKKRARLQQAEQPATPSAAQGIDWRTPETEGEKDTETELEGEAPPLDFSQSHEPEIPDGLAIVQYAGFVCEKAHIPASYGLKVKMGDAIAMLADLERCTQAQATALMVPRVLDAQKAGQKLNFWLDDGGWKTKEASNGSNQSVTRQRVDSNVRAVGEALARRGVAAPWSPGGSNGPALPEPRPGSEPGGVSVGLRAVGPQVLAGEGAEGASRVANQARPELLPPTRRSG